MEKEIASVSADAINRVREGDAHGAALLLYRLARDVKELAKIQDKLNPPKKPEPKPARICFKCGGVIDPKFTLSGGRKQLIRKVDGVRKPLDVHTDCSLTTVEQYSEWHRKQYPNQYRDYREVEAERIHNLDRLYGGSSRVVREGEDGEP